MAFRLGTSKAVWNINGSIRKDVMVLGVVIGDITGPRFEFDNYRHTDFGIFSPGSGFTGDTICTVTIADQVPQDCDSNLVSIL